MGERIEMQGIAAGSVELGGAHGVASLEGAQLRGELEARERSRDALAGVGPIPPKQFPPVLLESLIWLDAFDFEGSHDQGDAIERWVNKGTMPDLVSGPWDEGYASAQTFELGINGRPSVAPSFTAPLGDLSTDTIGHMVFDGAVEQFESLGNGVSVFAVWKATVSQVVCVLWDQGTAAPAAAGQMASKNQQGWWQPGGEQESGGPDMNLPNAVLSDWRVEFGVGSRMEFNGVYVPDGHRAMDDWAKHRFADYPFRLFRISKAGLKNTSTGRWFKGFLGEFIIIDQVLSVGQRQSVLDYLNVKWDL